VEDGYYRTHLRPPELPNPFGADEPPPFEEIADELTEVERVIYRRRSNRLFDKKKSVPEHLLRRLIEAARFAPSQGNCQPWSFIAITDTDLIERMGKACENRVRPLSKLYLRNNGKPSALRTLAVNLLARLSPNNFDQRLAHGINTIVSYEHWDTFLHAPAVIIVLGDQRGIGEPVIDCSLAAHNMVLAAHSLGLGTCYIGFAKMVNSLPELRRELGIEWPFKVMTSVAVGYPRTRTDKAVPRERPPITWFRSDRMGSAKEE
jgi:nitroreductase